ncbi:transcription factor RFX4-like isoform X2 [Clavelina lepadiformis]|uniref:transcription factor RFX4-like isoform X2 n=1 Tax=Clavelina lepadiformis TaxID=159417 RepID=UPI0040414180
MISSSQTGLPIKPSTKEFTVIDEQGNTVVPTSTSYASSSHANLEVNIRHPMPCSKQASITTDWLRCNFEENVVKSVPRNIMFEEYKNFCREKIIKPFNQAVFGKVVRACFPNLTTRRLGMRGQSRYHYAGLTVKAKSIYAKQFKSTGTRHSSTKALLRRREVGAHVTIDGSFNAIHDSIPLNNVATIFIGAPDYTVENFGSISLVLPPYPNEEDLILRPKIPKTDLATFLGYYRTYNKHLLGYIISLDFEKAAMHVQSLASFLPEECKSLMKYPSLSEVIAICDDIMFREATAALLCDCLASLTDDFNVTVRTFAKTLPKLMTGWVDSNPRVFCAEVNNSRIGCARQWCKQVLRITTLCHVAKEVREVLHHPNVVDRLKRDLGDLATTEIDNQCKFAACEKSDGKDTSYTKYYVNRFCELLQNQASLEMYAFQLELIVHDLAGLKPDLTPTSHIRNDADYEVITDQTRQFVLKWAMFTSKMLTEIALKSSESFGIFHLITLLFNDYIKHLVAVRDENAKRIKRLRSAIKRDSNYFSRLWASSSRQRGGVPPQHPNSTQRSYAMAPNRATRYIQTPLGARNSLPSVIVKEAVKVKEEIKEDKDDVFHPHHIFYSPQPKESAKIGAVGDNGFDNNPGPAVVVEPAFSSPGLGSNFYPISLKQ